MGNKIRKDMSLINERGREREVYIVRERKREKEKYRESL